MSTSFNSNLRRPATVSRLQFGGIDGVSRAIKSSSSKKTVGATMPCNRRLFIFFVDFRSRKLIGGYFRSFQNSTGMNGR
ncbi:hypothetical protein Hanom_Chr11g01057621 [Helianthus anomalus]